MVMAVAPGLTDAVQVGQSAVVTTACAGRQSIVLRGFAAEGMVEAGEGFPSGHASGLGWGRV